MGKFGLGGAAARLPSAGAAASFSGVCSFLGDTAASAIAAHAGGATAASADASDSAASIATPTSPPASRSGAAIGDVWLRNL